MRLTFKPLLIVLAANALVIAAVLAAPRAKSAAECAIVADLALNAAAHAKHGVPRETFDAVMIDIYDLQTEEAREIARLVTDAAWRASAAGIEPADFGALLHRVCRLRSGDMDSILGTSL